MRAAVLVATMLLGLAFATAASADEGDAVFVSRGSALVGEQFAVTIQVRTPRGATVEIDPAADSWGSVAFVRLVSETTRDEGDGTVHSLQIMVAAFRTGDLNFRPAVNVIEGVAVTRRVLPGAQLSVIATLRPADPNELSPLPPPTAIAGEESPFLRPGIVAGVVLAAALLAFAGFAGARAALRRLLRRPEPLPVPLALPGLGKAESLIDADPVGAYRSLAATVRTVLTARYGLPALALTSSELAGRMEAEGIDRWQARLVWGLLDECDAVVYAGYRPAAERRQADLVMAREIVEAAV